jgi:hypothetical protein
VANNISWKPSYDPRAAAYNVEVGPTVNGPWGLAAVVPHTTASNPPWNQVVGEFYHVDEVNPVTAWWRVTTVDTSGVLSMPSQPFVAQSMPYFVPGMTPFGIYDNDPQFQGDADKLVQFVRQKLGEPVMQVHMSSTQIYTAFEEATLEFSALMNSYQAKSNLTSFLGAPTGTLQGSEQKYPPKNLQFELQQSDGFGAEAFVNSGQPAFSASIMLNVGQQAYDLQALLTAALSAAGLQTSGTMPRIRVRELFHRSPLQAYRFFGTTSGLNYLNNQFRFESFTPETLFYLLPIWEDVLRGMQFKTSNTVRRSNYSFDLHNNVLRLFPAPSSQMPLWMTFTVDANPTEPGGYLGVSGASAPNYSGVSNISNIPYGNIPYSNINSISKHWIRRMTLALAKEIEGQIRSKFSTVPIPNGDLTLNGAELIADARAEAEALRGELRDILEATTYQKLMESEAQMAQNQLDVWKNVPTMIYIG